MSTIAAKPLTQYPWFIRLFFWKQKRTYGRILDPGLLWGRSPWVFAAVALLYGALDRRSSPIAPALRSLVTVRVSQINHCAFCVDINSATLAKRGVSMEKIGAISNWRDNAIFEAEECLAHCLSGEASASRQKGEPPTQGFWRLSDLPTIGGDKNCDRWLTCEIS